LDTEPLVFLLDVDNTLLDNDALKAYLGAQLGAELGSRLNAEFWDLYEAVRRETEVVNYPVVLDRFAALCPDPAVYARVRTIVMECPFAGFLYPATLDVLAHLRAIGRPAILSDGDPIYQPLKIERSGLAAAVEGRVLVYVHKEQHLPEVMATWPGALYVAVDDKARILAALKALHPDRFVTVHVRQGHYGTDPTAFTPAPDLQLGGIGELAAYSAADLMGLRGQ
jgi:hypothetical protein